MQQRCGAFSAVALVAVALVMGGCDSGDSFDLGLKIEGNGVVIADGHFVANGLDGTHFGEAAVNSDTVERDFEVTNTGSADITFKGSDRVQMLGGDVDDFQLVATLPQVLEPQQTATVRLRFAPRQVGARTTIVSLRYRQSESESASDDRFFSFRIQGTGSSRGAIAISSSLSGANIINGSTEISTTLGTDYGELMNNGEEATSSSFTIDNTATNGPLTISRVRVEGSGAGAFSVIKPPRGSVAVGTATTVIVEFRPTGPQTGQRQAVIIIESSDSTQPEYAFVIEGRATPAADG